MSLPEQHKASDHPACPWEANNEQSPNPDSKKITLLSAVLLAFSLSLTKKADTQPPSAQLPRETFTSKFFKPESQETLRDTVLTYPPDKNMENVKKGVYAYLTRYSSISVLGMGGMKKYFEKLNIKWDKENTKVDSLKLKIIVETPFDKLGISGLENFAHIRKQVINYYNLDQEYLFHFTSNIGPIYKYDEQYDEYSMLHNEAIRIFWKIKNPREDINIVLLDTQNNKAYVQFTAEAIKNTIYDENSNGRPETDEEYYERLRKIVEYIYKLPNTGSKGGFLLGLGLPRHFEGVWGDNPILQVPCADTDKLNLPFPSRFAALAQFEIGTQIEYINPDTTGAPGDSTGTPGDSTSTNPDNPNGNPEIPESYRLQVYPNPAEAGQMVNVLVHIPEPGNYTLRVFNLLGQEIWRKDYFINQKRTDHRFQFPTLRPDGQPHPRGIYFLQFSDKDGKTIPATQKLIITPQP